VTRPRLPGRRLPGLRRNKELLLWRQAVCPWPDFDVRQTHRALHQTRWSWGDVSLASGLSAASIVAVVVLWQLRKRRARSSRAV
jgi:hypothetical protein